MAMPTVATPYEHRPKITTWTPLFNALVTRVLTKKELDLSPKAQEALWAEFTKQSDKRTWIIEKVNEWRSVCKDAEMRGVVVHVARIFGIASVKGDELPEEHPEHKHKGRIVLQGNNVQDQHNHAAIFQELSSSPAGIEAAKIVDMFGLLPGHAIQQSDAEQAYLQAELAGGNTETWVRLPKQYWPDSWKGKYRDPVVPLRLALYGHPDAGGLWEKKCTDVIVSAGFAPVDGWPSLFFHAPLNVLLLVYVDDFKMAGKPAALKKIWAELRKELVLEDPHPLDRCLGCHHIETTETLPNGAVVRAMRYDMGDFIESCVARYLELVGGNTNELKVVATPFLTEPDPDPLGEQGSGRLGDIAASVLMKILYAARMVRFDLLSNPGPRLAHQPMGGVV